MTVNKDPWVMGISASHNGAVCLLKGDEVVVAIQEERLTRRKREHLWGAQRSKSLQYCLDYAGIKPSDLSMVVIAVQGPANDPTQDLKANPILQTVRNRIPTRVVSHHYAHAVSAFATSGFKDAAVLVIDGMGSPIQDLSDDELSVVKKTEPGLWEIISLYSASGTTIKALEKHMAAGMDFKSVPERGMYPFRSLGSIFQSAARQIFGGSMDAGKVMGLAPYGHRRFSTSDFFHLLNGEFHFQDIIPSLFPHDERWPLHQQQYQDLACSAQLALEEALLYLVKHLHTLQPSSNLCYAGGVALNSVANERIIRESEFSEVFIIPAAEDSGPAIGAAYHGLWELLGQNTQRKLLHDAVGRDYSLAEIEAAISETPGVEEIEGVSRSVDGSVNESVDADDYLDEVVERLCQGKSVGWFQGRSELGPRALGQRSILCDPRRAAAKAELNSRVKRREAFRPFAPVVPIEDAQEWFEWEGSNPESPYMLRVAKFREEKVDEVPAVVHVDGTGRVQTVREEANGELYRLVKRFGERTGVPVILNTSFNVMGMPIVETPQDALYCLQLTGLDCCVLGSKILEKRQKVLLGLDVKPHEQEGDLEVEGNDRNDDRRNGGSNYQVVAKSSFTLKDYAGKFQNDHGVLNLEVDGHHLKGDFNGMPASLEECQKDTFRVTSPLLNKSMVVFMGNEEGKIDRLSVFPGPDTGMTGEFVFRRVVEIKELRKEDLKSLTGRYAFEDQNLEVSLRNGSELIVSAPGQPDYVLVHSDDYFFNVKNTPGYSIEFNLHEGGVISRAVLTQPNGAFSLRKV